MNARPTADLIAGTGHDRLIRHDYRSCAPHSLLTVRDGRRYHLVEREPSRYDWSSWLPMLEAAAESGVHVMWDLFHYGSPDHLDQGSEEFVLCYARFAAAAVRLHGRSRAGARCGRPIPMAASSGPSR